MINVFICTYNPNQEYLRRTIEGILNQDLDRSLWDLRIIDNNSQTRVSDFDFIKHKNIEVIVEKKQGLTAARGCATSNAKGDILVFIDDDLVIASDYLSQVQKLFQNSKIGIISGNIKPEYNEKPENWFYEFEGMIAIRDFPKSLDFLPNEKEIYNDRFPIGAGMSIRKSLIEKYYSNHLKEENYIEGRKGDDLSSCEDLDLDFYAIQQGFTIGVSPKLSSIHLIPSNRIKLEYILKLGYYSLKSSFQLNSKWKSYFKHDVFDFFAYPTIKLLIRTLIHGLLKFIPSHLVRYHHFKNILLLRFKS